MTSPKAFSYLVPLIFILGVPAASHAKTLEVGEGKPFDRIEKACDAAEPGDTILVHPLKNGRPYEKTAVLTRKKNIAFHAAAGEGKSRVKISGKGFDYSGRGSVPRAIFQFDRGADDCTLEGFELLGAHNESHNGAGVRINGANRAIIRNCSIHNNDMGVMSNSDGGEKSAAEQRFEHCEIHHNGDPAEPGQNHNLYLGGESAALSFCDIHSSLTGHNLKSRAHLLRVEYCFIHDSANRELDLVDSTETSKPESDALLIGNIIAKDPQCKGNRTVIHFGQDVGKGRDGTVYLYFNTIVTPFVAPVIDLSSPRAKAELVGNLIYDGDAKQKERQIVAVRGGVQIQNLRGRQNWLAGGFVVPAGTMLNSGENRFGSPKFPLFADPTKNDYHLTEQARLEAKTSLSADGLEIPPVLKKLAADSSATLSWQYRHPAEKEERTDGKNLIYGAYGR